MTVFVKRINDPIIGQAAVIYGEYHDGIVYRGGVEEAVASYEAERGVKVEKIIVLR